MTLPLFLPLPPTSVLEIPDYLRRLNVALQAIGVQVDHGELTGLADDDHPQYIKHSLATVVNDFLVASGGGAFVKMTLAEVKALLGLGDAIAIADRSPITSAFTRATVAYKQDGSQVASGVSRYEAAKYSNGITVEEGVANLLTANQSDVETDTAGFTINAGTTTLSCDTATFRRGAASLKAACAVGAWNGFYTNSTTVTASLTYTASVWIKGTGANFTLSLQELTSGDAVIGSTDLTGITITDTWTRYSITRTFGATGVHARIFVASPTSQACIFYTDELQLEAKPYATTWHVGAGTRNAETLTVPNAAISSAAGTVECWLKLLRAPGTNQEYILDLNGATNYGLKFYIRTDGKLECVFGTGAAEVTITGTNVLAVDTLYHVAVTWAATGVTIYRNGSSEGTSGTAPGIVAGALVYLGSKADGTLQLDGIIEVPCVYYSALSGTDITAIYNRTQLRGPITW